MKIINKSWTVAAVLLSIGVGGPTTATAQTEDFRTFLRDFFETAEFQIDHIKFPLDVVSYSYSDELGDFELATKTLAESDWEFMETPERLRCETNCYDLVIYDSFEKSVEDSGERVISFEGVENGINVSMYFRWITNRWILVRIEDLST